MKTKILIVLAVILAIAGTAWAGERYHEGQGLEVGWLLYLVKGSYWSDNLTDKESQNKPPDAKYLFVRLGVKNISKKARIIPNFKLVDADGAEYETAQRSYVIDHPMGMLTQINPGVIKAGAIVFDVPPGRDYGLVLSGGIGTRIQAIVDLTPTTK